MEKTEMMNQIEHEAELNATIQTGTCGELPRWWYVLELERRLEKVQAKAAAYDRIMSGGLSMKELANILKHPVAIENEDDQNELYYFNSTPYISQFSDGTQFWSCKRKWRLPRQLVNFCDIWEESLTFPDGWREK